MRHLLLHTAFDRGAGTEAGADVDAGRTCSLDEDDDEDADDAGILILHTYIYISCVCIADFYRRFLLRISIDVEIFAHFVYPVVMNMIIWGI